MLYINAFVSKALQANGKLVSVFNFVFELLAENRQILAKLNSEVSILIKVQYVI